MKKKFVLTLALVLMVAVTLSAATPVEVSGNFDYGYKFTFKDPLTIDGEHGSAYKTLVAVSSDYWKVTLEANKAINFTNNLGDGEFAFDGKADIYLGKALADEGVDMGDLDVTLHVAKGAGAPSVYAKKIGQDLKVGSAAANLGATVKYADLVDVFVSTNVETDDFETLAGAKFAPVDGVTAAVAYGTGQKAVHVSAAADIAALADLDFDLAASVGYRGNFSGSEATTEIGATVSGEYEGIGLWVAFATDLDVHQLGAQVSYGTTVEGFDLGASAKLTIADLSDVKLGLTLNADAGYTMGDVTYNLNLNYVLDGDFSVTPSISFAW